MRVSLITPHLRAADRLTQLVALQTRFFNDRGDEVAIYSALPADQCDETLAQLPVVEATDPARLRDLHFVTSDLFIFHGAAYYDLLTLLPQLERGAVIFYWHQQTAPGLAAADAAALAPILTGADLVVAEGVEAARTLTETYSYTMAPVHVLPVDDTTTPHQYAVYWTEAVAAATAWLPNRPYPFGRLPALEELHPPPEEATPSVQAPPREFMLEADIQSLLAAAATAQRNYVVRSRIPVIGGLIAWLRRNLTSHLREPYIDPTFQRQERFNRLIVEMVAAVLAQQRMVQAALEGRVRQLEERLAEVSSDHQRAASQSSTAGSAASSQPAKPPDENQLS